MYKISKENLDYVKKVPNQVNRSIMVADFFLLIKIMTIKSDVWSDVGLASSARLSNFGFYLVEVWISMYIYIMSCFVLSCLLSFPRWWFRLSSWPFVRLLRQWRKTGQSLYLDRRSDSSWSFLLAVLSLSLHWACFCCCLFISRASIGIVAGWPSHQQDRPWEEFVRVGHPLYRTLKRRLSASFRDFRGPQTSLDEKKCPYHVPVRMRVRKHEGSVMQVNHVLWSRLPPPRTAQARYWIYQ